MVGNGTGVITERGPDTVRGPDVAYLSFARQPTVQENYFEVGPDLAVEVLSPSNRRKQVEEKIAEYLENRNEAGLGSRSDGPNRDRLSGTFEGNRFSAQELRLTAKMSCPASSAAFRLAIPARASGVDLDAGRSASITLRAFHRAGSVFDKDVECVSFI